MWIWRGVSLPLSMRILIWNIRGFNIPFKQQEVRKEVKRLNVNIICLVETRVKKDKAQNIKNAVLPGWNLIHNYDMHWLGRIWVCWDPGITSIKLYCLLMSKWLPARLIMALMGALGFCPLSMGLIRVRIEGSSCRNYWK